MQPVCANTALETAQLQFVAPSRSEVTGGLPLAQGCIQVADGSQL